MKARKGREKKKKERVSEKSKKGEKEKGSKKEKERKIIAEGTENGRGKKGRGGEVKKTEKILLVREQEQPKLLCLFSWHSLLSIKYPSASLKSQFYGQSSPYLPGIW